MKGEDLKKLLENNSHLLTVDIRYTIAYLLKRRLINPSVGNKYYIDAIII